MSTSVPLDFANPALFNLLTGAASVDAINAAIASGLIQSPPLGAFITLQGKTLVGAAKGLGVDPNLFVRVSLGEQPFPFVLLKPLAQYLNTDVGTLQKVCGQVTNRNGPFNRVLLTARPPDPSKGDPYVYAPITQNLSVNPTPTGGGG